jgi:hypothetical protein
MLIVMHEQYIYKVTDHSNICIPRSCKHDNSVNHAFP